jgi:hypothetical protein
VDPLHAVGGAVGKAHHRRDRDMNDGGLAIAVFMRFLDFGFRRDRMGELLVQGVARLLERASDSTR